MGTPPYRHRFPDDLVQRGGHGTMDRFFRVRQLHAGNHI